jgi:hypothetical protein
MVYIPNTAILQDRTLDLVREHDNIMLNLKREAEAKKEEREKQFVELMSIDTVNTLNTTAHTRQLQMIEEFNKTGANIYKNYPNGNVSVADKMKLMTMKRDLQQQQQAMAQTLKTVDEARRILTMDTQGRFDRDDSQDKITEFIGKYDGTQAASLEDLLEAGYVNFGSQFSRLQNQTFPINYKETRTIKDPKTGEDVSYTIEQRRNISTLDDMVDATIRLIDNDKTGLLRSLDRNMQKDDFAEAVMRQKEAYIQYGDDVAEKIAATEVLMSRPLESIWGKTAQREVESREQKARTTAQAKFIPSISAYTPAVGARVDRTVNFTGGKLPMVRISAQLLGEEGRYKAETFDFEIEAVDVDRAWGKIKGNYTLQEGAVPKEVINSTKDLSKEMAIAAYKKAPAMATGFGNITGVVHQTDGTWLPIVEVREQSREIKFNEEWAEQIDKQAGMSWRERYKELKGGEKKTTSGKDPKAFTGIFN